MLRKFILGLVLALIATPLFARDCSVRGQIGAGDPIVFVDAYQTSVPAIIEAENQFDPRCPIPCELGISLYALYRDGGDVPYWIYVATAPFDADGAPGTWHWAETLCDPEPLKVCKLTDKE